MEMPELDVNVVDLDTFPQGGLSELNTALPHKVWVADVANRGF
jgi:hypothetical protein